jgi:hypothetical protein
MPNKPSKKAISFHQFLQKVQQAVSLSEQRLKKSSFYIYRTDTHQVLARDVDGFEAAKDKANRLRRQLGLKWDQVKFKMMGSPSSSTKGYGSRGGYRVDSSPRYNPSKRGHFRGYYDNQGSFHDLD